MWLLIQRQTLAVQSCRNEKPFASVLPSCEADTAGASANPHKQEILAGFVRDLAHSLPPTRRPVPGPLNGRKTEVKLQIPKIFAV